jgi:hypothetical protein
MSPDADEISQDFRSSATAIKAEECERVWQRAIHDT